LHLSQIFCGRRAAITDIIGKYQKENYILLGVHGESGMGKTVLATQLSNKLLPRFPDAQFYIDLKTHSKNPVSVADAMAQVIWSYRPMAKLPTHPDELAALYFSVLRDQRAIIMLDNADATKAKSLIPPKNCILLTISHQPLAIPKLYNRKIDIFPSEEARELLKEVSPRAEFWVNEISKLCDYLPLAIVIVGRFLNKTNQLDPTVFLEKLRGLRDVGRKPGEKGIEHVGLSMVLAIVTKFLSEQTAIVWRKLLVFPGTFSAKAVEAVCDDLNSNHLTHLESFNLVSHNYDSDRYFLHEMVREYLVTVVNKLEQGTSYPKHATYFLTVLNTAKDMYQQDDNGVRAALHLLDMEWGNIQAAFAWSEKMIGKDGTATKMCSAYLETGYDLFKYRLRPANRIKWLEIALKASRIVQDTEAENSHLLNLGLENSSQGSFPQALDYLQQALELAKKLNKKSDEGVVLRQMGIAHAATGNIPRALEFHQQEMELARSRGDKTDEGKALMSLGHVYKISNDIPHALEFFQRCLLIAQESGEKRMEGQALKDMADTRLATENDLAPILDLYAKALSVFQSTKDKHGEALILKSMGQAEMKMNNNHKAAEFFEKAIAVFRKARDMRNEGLALHHLGLVHEAERKLPSAIEVYNKALELLQRSGDKKEMLVTLEHLGKVYKESVENDRAIKAYERGLVLAKELMDRSFEGKLNWHMSQVLEISGNRPKAVKYAELAAKCLESAKDSVLKDEVKKKLEEMKTQKELGK
jgi:tetratricopeptide (TPR) repeat protein